MNYYKNDIRNVKGDTFSCAFNIENLQQDIETANFTCRDSLNDNSNVLFQKTLNNGISLVETDVEHYIKKYAVRVAPDDTKDLQSGTYYYDLEIGVNSDIFTIMKGRFIVEQDCTRNPKADEDIVLKIDLINGEVINYSLIDKLNYLDNTKTLMKNSLIDLGAEITDETTFRNYVEEINSIYNNYPKVTGEGSSMALPNTKKAKMNISLYGNSIQNGTPSTSIPVNIQTVTGENEIIEIGKNICLTDISAWESGQYGTDGTKQADNNRIRLKELLKVEKNTKYRLSASLSGTSYVVRTYNENKQFLQSLGITNNITTSSNVAYLGITVLNNNSSYNSWEVWQENWNNVKPQIEAGSTITTYEEHQEKIYPLSLENLELLKIGTNKDIIQKNNDNWSIPNKILKIASYDGETITTDYISTTGGLDTGATVYYVGTESYIITDETLISQLNAISNMFSNDGGTNIICKCLENNAPIIVSASALMKGGS